MNGDTDNAFEALLRYMRDARGFDFAGYKRTSLMRRVRHRMDQAGYAVPFGRRMMRGLGSIQRFFGSQLRTP